ncbi:hypothetical protein [Phytoactinopolyspora halotolerans]|uniref:Uncharacterized protein n=1 Tax=Phytoactinopolyspora halotolerans TaxID=1981512 RepID=A0A6L9SA70_9ACTN|nr:hypothetical protein [Phytoactinopolyspora halotolerans]NEE01943.1 hypothetical protein [Phytoactinopolyspora halotolerans]
MQDIDERLVHAMRRVAVPETPPVDDLVSGGIARGERMRRRRVWAVAGGGLVTALATAVALVAVPEVMGRPEVAPGADDVSVDLRDESSGEDTGDDSLDEAVIVEVVLDLLPAGDVSEVRSGVGSEGQVWFEFVYDDGAGASVIQGSVSAGESEAFSCPVIVNGGECEMDVLADGTKLMRMAGPYYPQADREPERLLWSVHVSRPDGLRINLGEMNAPTEKGSDISRPEPPLTLDQLTAIVTSDRWRQP